MSREEALVAFKEGFRKLINMERAWVRLEVVYHRQRFIGQKARLLGAIYLKRNKRSPKFANLILGMFDKYWSMDKDYHERADAFEKTLSDAKEWNDSIKLARSY